MPYKKINIDDYMLDGVTVGLDLEVLWCHGTPRTYDDPGDAPEVENVSGTITFEDGTERAATTSECIAIGEWLMDTGVVDTWEEEAIADAMEKWADDELDRRAARDDYDY